MAKKKKTHETPAPAATILSVRGNAYAEIPVTKAPKKADTPKVGKTLMEVFSKEDEKLAKATGVTRLSRLRNKAWKLQHGKE